VKVCDGTGGSGGSFTASGRRSPPTPLAGTSATPKASRTYAPRWNGVTWLPILFMGAALAAWARRVGFWVG
jgi:hypothetical protein